MNHHQQSIQLTITLCQKMAFFHCQITAQTGEILVESGGYSHPRDAIYAALHGLAVDNNFSGCLNLDNENKEVA